MRFVLGRGSTGLFQFWRVGDAYADRIWREQVRKRTAEMRVLDNVWFTDKAWIVSLDTLRQDGEGTGFVAYRLSDDGLRFVSIVRGPSFHADPGAWLVRDAVRISPDTFVSEPPQDMTLPLEQEASVFFVSGQDNPQQLPLWLLGRGHRQTAGRGLQRGGPAHGLARQTGLRRLAYGHGRAGRGHRVLAGQRLPGRGPVYGRHFRHLRSDLVRRIHGAARAVAAYAGRLGPDALLLILASLRLRLAGIHR